ncbi:MAG: DUF3237 domain-containing protein [Clostridia bacterium]|nr:DUF3237 domain-containing protein [Clostridia bacterium]
MEPILDVHVLTRDAVSLDAGPAGSVLMIPFGGTVSSRVFEGIVEPCGVDTQVVNPAGVRHMSARYMLTGKALPPYEERDCRIYVENNGWFTGDVRMPFRTTPAFITDHPGLAAYLRGAFVGVGSWEADGLHIRFYEADTQP